MKRQKQTAHADKGGRSGQRWSSANPCLKRTFCVKKWVSQIVPLDKKTNLSQNKMGAESCRCELADPGSCELRSNDDSRILQESLQLRSVDGLAKKMVEIDARLTLPGGLFFETCQGNKL
jgi:hypothetical protein